MHKVLRVVQALKAVHETGYLVHSHGREQEVAIRGVMVVSVLNEALETLACMVVVMMTLLPLAEAESAAPRYQRPRACSDAWAVKIVETWQPSLYPNCPWTQSQVLELLVVKVSGVSNCLLHEDRPEQDDEEESESVRDSRA